VHLQRISYRFLFLFIYLYQNNYSIIEILFFFFLLYLSFVIFAYPLGKLVGTIGKKHAILLSVPFMITYLFMLRSIPEAEILFFIAPVIISIRQIFFNFGYHLEFLESSDSLKRSSQMSNNEIVLIVARALAPILGGIISFQRGFTTLFTISIILSFLSVIPLFLSKDTPEKTKLRGVFHSITKKKHRPLLFSYSGYAIETAINKDLWPIYLILILGTTQLVGGLVGFTTLLAIIVLFIVGRISDSKNKKKLLQKSTILHSLSWIGRIFATSTSTLFIVDTYKNIIQKFLMIPWGAYSYEVFSRHNYFGHIVEREIIFNLSRIVFIPLLIIIFWINIFPFIITFILAFSMSLLYSQITKYN